MAALLLVLLAAPDFVDIAEESGLKGVPSGRAVLVDLNADGRLDVVLSRRHFFVQAANGRFAPAAGLPEIPTHLLFADFDNDGDQDAFTTWSCEPENPKWRETKDKGQRNRIYRREADGSWTAIDVDMPRTSVHSACTFDYDRDGNLDLFVGSGYVVYGRDLTCHTDRLYRGDGKGGFRDVTKEAGLVTGAAAGASRPTYGVTHGDFDGDGRQDIWVCTYGRQRNFLWRDVGTGTFYDIAAATGFAGDDDASGVYPQWTKDFWKKRFGHEREDEKPFRANGNTFDCAIADFDNDGDMDCILAEITHAWAGSSSDRTSLLINTGKRFVRKPDAFARTHVGDRWNQGDIHCGWLDFDNDGLLDALIASSDYPDRQELKLYRQRPDHTFEKARTFGWEGAGQISIGDIDNDGDEDILCGRSLNRLPKERREALGPSVALFRNDVGNKRGWLQVVCRGVRANRDGIGCRIAVTTADGVTRTREIRGGLGHACHNGPYVAHFGLGGHETALRVEVVWPDRDGTKTVLKDVRARQRLVVTQPS